MGRAPSGFCLMLRTPPGTPATHVRPRPGHEHGPGTTPSISIEPPINAFTPMRATSRRKPARSSPRPWLPDGTRALRPGKPATLLWPAPLRTGLAPFNASGSSKPRGLVGGQKRRAPAVAAAGVYETGFVFVWLRVLRGDDLDDCLAGISQPRLPLDLVNRADWLPVISVAAAESAQRDHTG